MERGRISPLIVVSVKNMSTNDSLPDIHSVVGYKRSKKTVRSLQCSLLVFQSKTKTNMEPIFITRPVIMEMQLNNNRLYASACARINVKLDKSGGRYEIETQINKITLKVYCSKTFQEMHID